MNTATKRIAGAAAMAVAVATALAGCASQAGTQVAGSSSPIGSAPPSQSTVSAAPTVTLGTGSATPVPGATANAENQPAGPPACTGAQIRQSTGPLGAAMGHQGEALVFTNTSGTTCTITGYPGATVSKPGGSHWDAARVLSSYLGGATGLTAPPVVTLAPGAAASALLMWTDVQDPSAPCRASGFTQLQTTTPNTQSTVTYNAANGDYSCENMQVTPVVPGTTGETQQQ
ncbi:MAG TPA: DUF4232 domain-containing protein [Actinocrinis sp.]|nr:DUF4232 domain-containing protein [Actinocrinis sp.]